MRPTKIFCFLLIGFSIAGSALAQSPQVFENQIVPFTSDGCSAAPDAMFWQDYGQCCESHDFAYWKGGTYEEKVYADSLLKECINDHIPLLGDIFELGVSIGGSKYLTTAWKWGYGWVLDRPYSPLTPSEKEKVAAAQGNLDDVVQVPTKVMGRRPAITGDHCLDKALNHMMIRQQQPQLFYTLEASHVRGGMEGLIYTFEIRNHPSQCLHTIKILTLPGWRCDAPTVSELGVRGGIRIQSEAVDCGNN